MCPKFRFIFLLLICSIQISNCFELQPIVSIKVSDETLNEYNKVIDEVHKIYSNGRPNLPQNDDGFDDSKQNNSKKDNKLLELEENLKNKFVDAPTLSNVNQPTEATIEAEESQVEWPSTFQTGSTNSSNGTIGELKEGTAVDRENNTKDVMDITNAPSDSNNAKLEELKEVLLQNEMVPNDNNTGLSRGVDSTASSTICIRNIFKNVIYVLIFIISYYYNLGLK